MKPRNLVIAWTMLVSTAMYSSANEYAISSSDSDPAQKTVWIVNTLEETIVNCNDTEHASTQKCRQTLAMNSVPPVDSITENNGSDAIDYDGPDYIVIVDQPDAKPPICTFDNDQTCSAQKIVSSTNRFSTETDANAKINVGRYLRRPADYSCVPP